MGDNPTRTLSLLSIVEVLELIVEFVGGGVVECAYSLFIVKVLFNFLEVLGCGFLVGVRDDGIGIDVVLLNKLVVLCVGTSTHSHDDCKKDNHI